MNLSLAQARWTRLSPLVETDRAALAALAGRLRDGDMRMTEDVLRELLPSVTSWVRRLLGPRDDVEDAVQECLTEIAFALPRFEGRSSIHTLAHRITTRTASRFYARRRVAIAETEERSDEGADAESHLRARQEATRLYRHLDQMSELRRTAFVLCCLEELTPSEAADVVGCSAVTMRSRVFEARAELLERIQREERTGRSR